jgi:hypothetical protein
MGKIDVVVGIGPEIQAKISEPRVEYRRNVAVAAENYPRSQTSLTVFVRAQFTHSELGTTP